MSDFPRHLQDKWERWLRWLEAIEKEINTLTTGRFVYQYVRDVIQGNPDLPKSHFLQIFSLVYVNAQTAAIRRLVEASPRDQPLSLALLLVDIRDNPEVLSRERYLSLWRLPAHPQAGSSELERMAVEAWTNMAGGGDMIDPLIVDQDLQELQAAASRVAKYADRYVAHADPRGMEEPPTFGEIHAAVDQAYKTFEKYLALLKCTSRASVVPAFPYDWNAFFRVAWLHPDFDPPKPE